MTGKEPADPTTATPGYVYLIHNPRTGFYKIGSARKPNTRLTQLCSEMRADCVILHTIATNASLRLEREAQSRFLDAHQGGEWFDLTSADVELICSVSTVFYRDVDWKPRDKSRAAFDRGAKWAKGLPICGATEIASHAN